MGCCSSSNFKSASAPNHLCSSDVRSDIPHQDKAVGPPLPPEEESVKEVLSETPVPKPQIPNIEIQQDNKPVTSWPAVDKVVPKPTTAPPPADETSEMSDLCSNLSESVSALSTATAPTEEGEVRQRSPAKFRNRPVSGQRNAVGKSPIRRSSQPSPGRVVQTGLRDRQRRDLGEISGRRSRSPATRVADGGAGVRKPGLSRSPSSRKTGKSPRSDPDKCLKQEESAKREGDKWPPMPPTVNESLENPLVSLECFIFL